jgi:beta-mannosidase
VRVTVNGKVFDQSLPEGIGLHDSDPAHLAFPATVAFDIPAGVLREGGNALEVRVENAGWCTWDSLCLTGHD